MISAAIITLLIALVRAGPVHVSQGKADLTGIITPDASLATSKRAGVPPGVGSPAAAPAPPAAPVKPPVKLPGRAVEDGAYPAPPYHINNANEVYRRLDLEVGKNAINGPDDCDDTEPHNLNNLVDIKAIQDPKTNVKSVVNDACAIRKRYVSEIGVNANDKIKDLLDDIVIELQRREGPLADCDMPDHIVHATVNTPALAPGKMNLDPVANVNTGPIPPKTLDELTATMCVNVAMPNLAMALKVDVNAVEARCRQLQDLPPVPVTPKTPGTPGTPGPPTVVPHVVSTIPEQTCTCP